MMRRRFSKAEKLALSVVQDVDHRGMHADHVVPFSKGGPTDVINGQLLQPRTNQAKGDTFMELRSWQQKFLKLWRGNHHNGRPFLLVCTPGGGKTVAAMSAANMWREVARDRRLLVVVPTRNLREQWRAAACGFGVELQTKEFGISFKEGYQGAAVTYQSVAMNSLVFRKLASSASTMVVLDEPHHCGVNKGWGEAVEESFGSASERLLLSGTPFRTDGGAIPFVTYDADGRCVPDYLYGYPDALSDGVVRWLALDYGQGSSTILRDGVRETLDMNSSIPDEQAMASLRYFLHPDHEFIRETVVAAHEKLQSIRRTVPDAAAMAACMDQEHAQKVASVIRRCTGVEPAVIVSDDDKATGNVESFRSSRQEWVVSVRQVSEGTDIPRLQVLCYFTNYVTDMFFRQLIGRVSRVRNHVTDEMQLVDREAFVYLPSDPRLIRCAQNIEQAQRAAITPERLWENEPARREAGVARASTFLHGEHDGTEVRMVGNDVIPQQDVAIIDQIAGLGLTQQTAKEALAIVRSCGDVSPARQPTPNARSVSLEQECDKMRHLVNNTAFMWSKKSGISVKEVHGQFCREFGKAQKDFTLEELRTKYDRLKGLIREHH